ncbi:hypothetical protein SMD44_00895 [Streptomyces alboflavus]|uniref:Uncharacterized protein n=1 Tax=Streptomyces alboflavus TaxID=67267 RepID=A0A1Z1W519_9ACTN|nr:hypothetical protein [Streptomyces alboflavus]ARX81497.1 hypothetical protein SMD44_00895 [Streptomyces alboflavus]
MPFPPSVQTVTVTAGATGYRHPDGTPYSGVVRFTPTPARVVSAEYDTILVGTVNASLGASGGFSVALLATDAADFSPTGWTYRVDEEFTNAPGRSYCVRLPAAQPAVALPDLEAVTPSEGTPSDLGSSA